MKSILITGGAGFLGTNLIDRLINDDNYIICMDNLITGQMKNIEPYIGRANFTFIKHDICDPIVLPDSVENIDEIYHFACLASPIKYKMYPIETLETSINGTQNVLKICLKYNAKLLFTSTSEVYGDPLVHPQPESYYGNVNTVGERSCYDEGKRVCETLIYEYQRKYNIDTKIVRLFNTYGPKMDIDDGRVITNFIQKILQGKPVEIFGDGTQTRSFCYVDDMIDALILMMGSRERGPINLGNPDCEFTLNQLVETFNTLLDDNIKVTYLSATQDDPKVRKPIIDKAHDALGWRPKTTLLHGLEKTLRHFSDCNNNIYYSVNLR
jgi:UDP-glucuronate decarboxylase